MFLEKLVDSKIHLWERQTRKATSSDVLWEPNSGLSKLSNRKFGGKKMTTLEPKTNQQLRDYRKEVFERTDLAFQCSKNRRQFNAYFACTNSNKWEELSEGIRFVDWKFIFCCFPTNQINRFWLNNHSSQFILVIKNK